MVVKDGRYTVNAGDLEIPEGITPNEFIFGDKDKEKAVLHIHQKDQLVVVKRGDKLLDYRYDALKKQIRSRYKGQTVFPIVENERELLEPLGTVRFVTQWLLGVLDDRMYFHGDTPRVEVSFDDAKIADMALIDCKTEKGRPCSLFVIVDSLDDRKFVKDAVSKPGNRLSVTGMNCWIKKGNSGMEKHIIASRMEVLEETFVDIKEIFPKIRSVKDVCVWRDLVKDTIIPSEIEAAILTSSLFFSYEGYAAINLIMLGEPACGKSHQMDTFAYLLGTKNHNCTETTLKGLIFSHAEKGGMPGILYRERFVALLNEFVRIVGNVAARRETVNEEVRRMLSSLNDAVEKKRDRSRSSGKVEGADATMICSMITSDNYYPSVVGPFVSAMMEDSSYLRRYSFLMLSDGTHTRGRSHSKVVDWRKSTDQLLFKRGIKPFQWGKLMSYWRSQIPDAMRRLDLSLYQKFGDKYAKDKVDALFFKGGIN